MSVTHARKTNRKRAGAFVIFQLVLMFGALLSSCGRTNVVPMQGISGTGGADEIREYQVGLMSNQARNAAGQLLQEAQRPVIVGNGIVKAGIDLSAGTIDYYSVDPDAAAAQFGSLDADFGPLEVVDYGPSGYLPMENSTPRIYVMFNQPMVPVTQLGDPITENDFMTIEPRVAGVYRWYGTKTLSFEPDVPLIDQPEYRVNVSSSIRSLSGERLSEDLSFSIFGERLKMTAMRFGPTGQEFLQTYNVPTAAARMITLEFNQAVDLDSIADSLSVTQRGRSYRFSIARPQLPEDQQNRIQRSVVLELSEEPSENSNISVELAAGAKPFSWYPETDDDQSMNFRTIYPFEAEQLNAYSGDFPMDNEPFSFPVYAYFSHPLAEGADALDYTVRLDGSEVAVDRVEQYYRRLRLFVPGARPGQEIEVDIPVDIQDIYGRQIEEPVTLSYEIPRPYPVIDFPRHSSGLRHLEAEFDPSIVFTMRNITAFSLGMEGTSGAFFQSGTDPQKSLVDLSNQLPDYVYFHQRDLSDYLNDDGYGTVRFAWRAQKDPELVGSRQQASEEGSVFVQVTDLGITTRYAYNRLLIWVNRLSDGTPVGGADVHAFNLEGAMFQAETDDEGLAVINLEDGVFARNFYTDYRTSDDDLHIRVNYGSDKAELLVASSHNAYRFDVFRVSNPQSALVQNHRVFLFTDRGLYQAGEELAIRGIHWLQDANGFQIPPGSYQMTISSMETGREIWSQQIDPSDSGGFSARLTLPEDLEPGDYRIAYHIANSRYSTRYLSFYVGNFRRLNFQVNSEISLQPIYSGQNIPVSISASYLSGGAVPSADYHFFWTRKPVRYAPDSPQWKDWSFGTSEWGYEQTLESGDGVLSGSGTATVNGSTAGQELDGKPYAYTLETRVEDIDRQVVSSTVSTLVHPASFYLGARFSQGSSQGWWSRFVPVDADIVAEVRSVDLDGQVIESDSPITVGLIKGEWKAAQQQGLYGRISTRWEYVEEEVWQREASLDDGAYEYRFQVDKPGRYSLYFIGEDELGRSTRTEIPFYASGSGWVQTASQTPEDIDLVVDKSIYEPGDTARILVQSPVPQGRYLLSIEREGILSQQVIELDGSTEVIEVPVLESYVPVFYVALTSFTERTETEDDYFQPDLGRPRGLFGITSVRVATTPIELDVQVSSAQPSYRPGDRAQVEVRVTKDGNPVRGAEVTLLAVDRGVLDLIDYHVPDPIEFFYNPSNFPLLVQGDDSRRLLLRPVTYDISTLQGGDGEKMDEREDFNPLALFEPEITTDANGIARVEFELPDSLTTYRITALALQNKSLGSDEAELMVNNPVNVRTAIPRRFRSRDTAAAGVILTNTTGEEVRLTVSAESDILNIVGEASKEISIPANSVYELPFHLEALQAGSGEIRFTTRSAVLNEVLVEEVVVERPLVVEAFTSTGVLFGAVEGEEGVSVEAEDVNSQTAEAVLIPSSIGSGYGSLAVNIDSSLVPYVQPSAENLLLHGAENYSGYTSQLYDLAARAMGFGSPAQNAFVLVDLSANQFPSGGIGYRSPRNDWARPSLFLSVLTAQVASIADEYDERLNNPINMDKLYAYLLQELRNGISAQADGMMLPWVAFILAEQGKVTAEDLAAVGEREDGLGMAGYNLLAQAYLEIGETGRARETYRRSKNFMNIGTQSVDLIESYEVRGYFDTMEAETAVFLRSAVLLDEAPELILKVAGTLNQERNQRRFHSNFDDFWMLYGFSPLLRSEENSRITRVAAQLGDIQLFDQTLERDEASLRREFQLFDSPLAEMPRDELQSLDIQREGEGPLYYSSILKYALPGETAFARNEGIELRVAVETLDGEQIHDNILPLGETLRMRVFINSSRRLSYLGLSVPVPSGAEIVDPNLPALGSYEDAGGLQSETWTRETQYGDSATFTGDGYAGYGPGGWWFWFYRPVQRIYDNAIYYMWEDFYAGDREVSFLFRTTTPGVYPTPPAQASLEFEPEIFGRSGGRLFVIRGQ